MKFRAWPLMFILALLFVPISGFAQEQISITPSDMSIHNTELKKKDAIVKIRTVKVESKIEEELSPSRSVVQGVNISMKAKQIFVPRSVFADLLDPREAKIQFEKGVFILTVSGGDGADSYDLRVYFDDKRIIRRELYSSLIPDKAVEETRYWLRILKDE